MQIFVPRECEKETRVAATPDTVKKFIQLGIAVQIESGCGLKSLHTDDDYSKAGAQIVPNDKKQEALQNADLILHVLPLDAEEIAHMKPKAWHVSFFDTFRFPEQFKAFQEKQTNVISLERIPRTSFAQKMDALSSQSSLAGYVSVMQGLSYLPKTLPMMVTPAGTLQAARVFIIGAGVAGLQAIATAKRLGARVEAFDTRQEVEEQVQSLGAKFVKIDLGKTESTQQGYAKALTEEQLERQRMLMLETCAHSDIVITTAKVFGRKAPLIINQAMLNAMKPGSVVVDLAVEAGGNTEGLVLGENTKTTNGVYLLGEGYWERKVATSATQMLAANFFALIQHLWNTETKSLLADETEPILKSCWCIKDGQQR